MGRPCQRWRAHVVAAPLGRRPLRVPRCPVAPRSLGPTLVFYKAFYVFIRVAVRETVLLGKCITHMRPGSCEQQPHTGTGTRLTTGPSRTSSRSAQFAAPSPMACKRQRSATSMRDAACDAQHHHLTLTTGDPRTDREHRRTSDSHPSRVTAQAKRTGTLCRLVRSSSPGGTPQPARTLAGHLRRRGRTFHLSRPISLREDTEEGAVEAFIRGRDSGRNAEADSGKPAFAVGNVETQAAGAAELRPAAPSIIHDAANGALHETFARRQPGVRRGTRRRRHILVAQGRGWRGVVEQALTAQGPQG